MRRILFAVCALFVTSRSFPQSGAVVPEKAAAGHAQKPSCVLLKRMGPADQVTSRLYSFGIRGKQFQYIEGKLPEGFPFHGRMTDHDVRNLQARGAEVIVLNQNYTPDELKQGRTDCQAITGQTPMQADAKPQPGATPAPDAKLMPAAATKADTGMGTSQPRSPEQSSAVAQLQISSTPAGADIEIDGNYVGNTPSTVVASAGQHEISVKKPGFKPWQRKIAVSAGQINVSASLEPQPK
ncbi:MAG TPA: PEGA domain-containing protein [Terriglobales bacterium]|nr:PEGA domain-containing protein [Terriglobales bacterium]